jgi:hypothetical protein
MITREFTQESAEELLDDRPSIAELQPAPTGIPGPGIR